MGDEQYPEISVKEFLKYFFIGFIFFVVKLLLIEKIPFRFSNAEGFVFLHPWHNIFALFVTFFVTLSLPKDGEEFNENTTKTIVIKRIFILFILLSLISHIFI